MLVCAERAPSILFLQHRRVSENVWVSSNLLKISEKCDVEQIHKFSCCADPWEFLSVKVVILKSASPLTNAIVHTLFLQMYDKWGG